MTRYRAEKVLVIGGAGYVGSHFCNFASQNGYEITVVDNLSKGHKTTAENYTFIFGDPCDKNFIAEHLSHNHYAGIFHFAANCLVGESVENPAIYYENNVIAAYNLLEAMRQTDHDKLVFSSTCAVYGLPINVPIKEDHPRNPISPYGRSKLAIEWMLEDYSHAYGIKAAMLRYFNAAGCEPTAGLGEDHRPESHLIPNVVRYGLALDPEFTIFGNDYPTPDGTCIRDYIHVTDLAEAHLLALEKLSQVYQIHLNLGTGFGLSNLEIVQAVEKHLAKKLILNYGPRRPGDPPKLVADASAASTLLNWKASRSNIDKIVSEVVTWFSKHPQGYDD
jgi:UDP-glucose 4-epimerase